VPLVYIDASIYFAVLCNYVLISTFTLSCLSIASRIRSRVTLPASSKNYRGSIVIRAYHLSIYDFWTRRRQTLRDHSLPFTYSPPMCTKRRFNCDFAFASHVILFTVDCLCPTARRERLARHNSLSCSMHSLQLPREMFYQSSDLAALLQQFVFHSLMIFHIFSQSLDHVALFHGALARDSFTHIATLWHI